jgi:hypothetical protein
VSFAETEIVLKEKKMNHKPSSIIFLAIVCMAIFLVLPGSAQEIPAGVRYKKTTDEINQKARQILEDALAQKADAVNIKAFSDSAIVCGPLLWDSMKDSAGTVLRSGKTMLHVIPAQPAPIRKEGKAFLNVDQSTAFWKLFIEKIRGNNSFKVRKAEAAEISYFWATIPFDIEEPLLVADFGKTKVVVNFSTKNGKPNIFWIDIVGDMKALKGP